MSRRFQSLRSAAGLVRSHRWLPGVGVYSVLVSIGAVYLAGTLFWVVLGDLYDVDVLELAIVSPVVLLAALFRSVLLAPVLAVVLPRIGPGRTPATDRRFDERTGSSRFVAVVRRMGSVVVATPAVYAVGGVVTLVALVPALAVYGVVATGIQALAYFLGVAEPGTAGTDLVVPGAVMLALPAAAAVGAGLVGFAVPRIARGTAVGVAVREGVLAFRRRPARWYARGLVLVGLTVAPLEVLAVAMVAFQAGTVPVLAVFGSVFGVALVAYTLGPAYRVAAVDPAAVGSTPEDSGPGDESSTSDDGTGRPSSGVLTARNVVLALLVSGAVLAGVGAVRTADLRPGTAAQSPPGYDSSVAPGEAVVTGIETVVDGGRIRTWEYYRPSPNRSEILFKRQLLAYDAGETTFLLVELWNGPGKDGWAGTLIYRDRNADLRREFVYHGNGSNVRLGANVIPEGSLEEELSYTRFREDVDPIMDHNYPFDLTNVTSDTFERVRANDTRVVFETVDQEAYCAVGQLRCFWRSDTRNITDARLRVVLNAETGHPIVARERIRYRYYDDEANETETSRRRNVYRFDPGPVDVDRPAAVRKGLLERIVDLVVY